MSTFEELLDLNKHLHGPDGCDWDKEQTCKGFAKHVREEAEELFEAIQSGDQQHIKEELGDLIWTLIFYAKLSEKEGFFTLDESLQDIKAKIIRRHPHVFGDVKVNSVQEIRDNWESIKRDEIKKKTSRVE